MAARPASVLHAPSAVWSVDDLDNAIVELSRNINAVTARLLALVREFDDRLGWAKWSFPNCPEWLAWRCGLSLSAAREKIRTAHALRGLPAISAAFAGRRAGRRSRPMPRSSSPGRFLPAMPPRLRLPPIIIRSSSTSTSLPSAEGRERRGEYVVLANWQAGVAISC